MADTYTTNLNLTKPEPGAAEDTWGISLNSDLDTLDAIFSSSGTQVNLNPNQVNFADNKKAVFNSNLNIFSTGTSSYIEEVGSGDLYLKASNLYITDRENNQFVSMIDNGTGGTLSLKHLGSTVLTTTSTGVAITGNATFDDNGKAIFGTGSDLQIYHDGTDSYIKDVGTGNLIIEGSSQLKLTGPAGDYFMGQNNGSAYLYHAGSLKAYTTSTGIDVTGTTVTDALTVQTVQGDISIANSAAVIDMKRAGTNYILASNSSGNLRLGSGNNFNRINITSGGDIAFYDDTGTTQGLFWDASAESLCLGNTSAGAKLDIRQDSGYAIRCEDGLGHYFRVASGGATEIGGNVDVTGTVTADGLTVDGGVSINSGLLNLDTGYAIRWGGSASGIYSGSGNSDMVFTAGSSERFRVNGLSGNVGIGTNNPSSPLSVHSALVGGAAIAEFRSTGNVNATIDLRADGTGDPKIFFDLNGATPFAIGVDNSDGDKFKISGNYQLGTNDRFVIDASGNVMLGKTSVDAGATQGFEFRADLNDLLYLARAGNAITLNRLSSDGDIALFRKDGTTVGSIGVDNSNNLYIQGDTTNSGLQCGTNAVLPHQSGADVDATIALGGTTRRFTSLHISDSIINDNASGVIKFRTNGSEAARFDSSGRLLVGTASVGYSGVDLTVGDTTDSQNGVSIQTSTTGIGYLLFGDGTDASAYVGQIAYAHSDNSMQFDTAGTERMRIDSSGSLVLQDGTAYQTNAPNGRGSLILAGASGGTGFGGIEFHTNAGGGSGYGTKIASSDATIVFQRRFNSATWSTSMKIDDSGNLGIGTSSLNAKLHVSDATAPTFRLSRTGTGQIWQQSIDSSGRFILQEAASEGGTKYTRLAVDDDGNVGIGTSSPSRTLDVESTSQNVAEFKCTTSAALAGDDVAAIELTSVNDVNGSSTSKLKVSDGKITLDADIGATGGDPRVSFEVEGNEVAGTDSGAFVVGTTSNISHSHAHVSVKNTVNGDINVHGIVIKDNTSKEPQTGSSYTDVLWNDGGDLYWEGDSISAGGSSDIRLKENIKPITDAVAKVKQLNGCTFNFKKNPEVREAGLIAQDVQKVLPEVVYEKLDRESNENRLALKYDKIISLLVESTKEQQEQIESLKSEIANLKGEKNGN